MSAQRNPDRLIHAFLEEGQTVLPDWVYDAVREQIETTRQRVVIAPWRALDMSRYISYGVAAAAVFVVVAFIGINALNGSLPGGPAATPTQEPTVAASPSPSPTPEPTETGWPTGAFTPGRHEVTLEGHSFSFAVEFTWSSGPFDGMILQGTNNGQRWIAFFNPFEQVSTDPCTGAAQTVGPTVDDFANAMTTIPGTDAVGPTDTTVGGLPAKLVTLTFHEDIPCAPTHFWLYGEDSAYPNNLGSVMSAWIVEVDGTRYVMQAHYGASDAEAQQDIQRIMDSIEFG